MQRPKPPSALTPAPQIRVVCALDLSLSSRMPFDFEYQVQRFDAAIVEPDEEIRDIGAHHAAVEIGNSNPIAWFFA